MLIILQTYHNGPCAILLRQTSRIFQVEPLSIHQCHESKQEDVSLG